MCSRSEGRDQTWGGMGGGAPRGEPRELPWGGPRVIGRTLGVYVGRSKSSKYKVTLRQGSNAFYLFTNLFEDIFG